MSNARFVSLVKDFCHACGIDDAIGIVDGGAVQVRGVRLSLVHSEKIDPDLLLIYADMGDWQHFSSEVDLPRLMKKNFFFTTLRGPVFALDPDGARLVIAQALTLSDLTAEQLIERLSAMSDRAANWRDAPLDDDDDLPAAPPAVAHPLQRLAAR